MMTAPAIAQRYYSPRISNQLLGIVGQPVYTVALRRYPVPGRCARVIEIAADETEFIAELRRMGYAEVERGCAA